MDKNKLLERIRDAKKKLEEIKKEITKKTIEQPLEYIKKKFDLGKKEVPKKTIDQKVENIKKKIGIVKEEISKITIGQTKVIETLLKAVIANGHVLLEGPPGIAKTLMVRTLAEITQCKFGRIQFTPDLLPLELVGLTTYTEKKGFQIIKGPIFNNFVLGDEINRAPPKTQSALLECMQEKQATIGNETFPMPNPFFTFATQNPIESLGTHPLPEAQLDRFLFKTKVDYPSLEEEQKILKTNISIHKFSSFKLNKVLSPKEIIDMQKDVKMVYLDKKLEEYIVKITDATRNPSKYNISLGKYIEWGSSPRASIGLFIASKAEAVLRGMSFVTPYHIRVVAPDVLRHRILLNYEGKSENVTSDDVVTEILKKVPIP